jgi:hypothetical protein
MAVKGTTGSLTVSSPSDREILMTRVFDAPRGLVFEAHSTPPRDPCAEAAYRHCLTDSAIQHLRTCAL